MNRSQSQYGLTLIEVLVALVLLSVLLIPTIRALHSGTIGADVHANVTMSHYLVSSRLEHLLAEPYTDLADAAVVAGAPTTASSYSDAAGQSERILVYLSFYDGDNADADNNPFTGTDGDLLWIRVAIENTVYSLETVTARGY